MQAMNVSGRVKSPPRSSKPMMIGAEMPARPPTPLNTPLVRPISRSGAVADTSDQWIEASPLAKNASDRNRMISAGSVHEIGADDAGGQRQAADDRRLARDAQAEAATIQPVRQRAGAQHAARTRARNGSDA